MNSWKVLQLESDLRGFSQSSLARAINISQPEISYYCRGKNYPRLEVIQKLAFHLNVSYNWLKAGLGTYQISGSKDLLEEFCKTFQERLIWLIWSRELTPSSLAKKLGLSSSTTVTYWCEGQRYPNDKNLSLISKFFGVSENWLVAKPNEISIRFEQAKQLGLSRSEYLAWQLQMETG